MSVVQVRLAALLHGYTGGRSQLPAEGETLGEVLADLDRRCPGLRFRVIDEQERVRRHMRCFINDADARHAAAPVAAGDEVFIVGALSGG